MTVPLLLWSVVLGFLSGLAHLSSSAFAEATHHVDNWFPYSQESAASNICYNGQAPFYRSCRQHWWERFLNHKTNPRSRQPQYYFFQPQKHCFYSQSHVLILTKPPGSSKLHSQKPRPEAPNGDAIRPIKATPTVSSTETEHNIHAPTDSLTAVPSTTQNVQVTETIHETDVPTSQTTGTLQPADDEVTQTVGAPSQTPSTGTSPQFTDAFDNSLPVAVPTPQHTESDASEGASAAAATATARDQANNTNVATSNVTTPQQTDTLIVDGSKKVFDVSDRYISYAIRVPRDRAFYHDEFLDPRFQYLTAQLAPAFVRVGGTGSNYLIYAMGAEKNCTWGGVRGLRNFTMECMSEQTYAWPNFFTTFRTACWDEMYAFFTKVGAKVVFCLNLEYPTLRMTEEQLPSPVWNSSNTEELLRHTVESGQNIYAYQLGNELSSAMTGEQHASHFHELQVIIDRLFVNKTDRPKLIGPDPHSYHIGGIFQFGRRRVDIGLAYMNSFFNHTRGILDAYAYHEYIRVYNGRDAVNTTVLDRSIYSANQVLNARRLYGEPTTELWVSETANTNRGGSEFGRSYGTAMWFIDAMAIKATKNHSVFCRQTLIGAQYGMIQLPEFYPNPSYWVAVLAKQLWGTGVLSTQPTVNTGVRKYAFCAKGVPGGITAILINLKGNTQYIDIASTCSFRVEYHFAPARDVDASTNRIMPNLNLNKIFLNGELLALDAFGQLPALTGRVVPSAQCTSKVVLGPYGISFIVLPEAKATACL